MQTELFNNLSESKVQKQIIEYLLKSGWLVIRINGGGAYLKGQFTWFYKIVNSKKSKGLSDLIAMKNGAVVLIEVKKNLGGELRQEQIEFIELAESKGVKVLVIENIDQLINYFGES